MAKAKAYFVATIIMALVGGLLYAFWKFNIRSYWIMIQILGWYGFAVGGVHLAHWLAKPAPTERTGKAWFPSVFEDEP